MKPVEIAWAKFKQTHNTSYRAIAYRASISYDHFWANIVHEKRHSPNRDLVEHILQKNDATEEETFSIMWASGYVPKALQGVELNTDVLLLMDLLSTPINSIQEEIRCILTNVPISMNKWAVAAKVDSSLFSRSMKEERSFSFSILEKLCECSFVTEIQRARILWSAGYVPITYFKRQTSKTGKATRHHSTNQDLEKSLASSVQETQ